MGNIKSVFNAIKFLGGEAKIINYPGDLDQLSHLIIPGVGAFPQAMDNLSEDGLIQSIKNFANTGKPLLGICLGMQILSDIGYEVTISNGLGLIEGEIRKFNLKSFRIPHVGWNGIKIQKDHYIFEDVKNESDFYFTHSYFFNPKNDQNILALTDYEISFASAVYKENVIGLQFHPEKSQKQGLRILANFIHYHHA